MDQIGNMAAFVKVAETSSFVKAAHQLRLSSTMVSKHVRALEERLGVKLLHRTTRRVRLTEIGAVFYRRCAELLAEFDELESATSSLHALPRGMLRVSAPIVFGATRISAMIPEFTSRYPDLTVDLTLTDRPVDLIEEGLDVAVAIGDLPDSQYTTRQLTMAKTVLCAAPSYMARKGTPQTPKDLAGHNCLINTSTPFLDEWAFIAPDGTRQIVKVSGNFHTNGFLAQRSAALHGQGITLQPHHFVDSDLQSGKLTAVLSGYTSFKIPLRLVYPSVRYLPVKTRAFLDFLVAYVARETL